MELKGKVLKIGRIKDYGHDTNFGRTWVTVTKFFMSVETDQGIINVMVECNAHDTEYGLRIPKEEPRQRPFIGDVVRFTTQRLRKNGDDSQWASVTFNQEFEVLEENLDARKEREEFIAAKKQERLEEFNRKKEEQKQARKQAKDARQKELDALRADSRLPATVQAEISSTFDLERIIALLRDTTWFTMPEGEGGHRCPHMNPVACGCQHPGTGMRRPGGCLYNLPATSRESVLQKGLKSGLITKDDKDEYHATQMGIKLLVTLDTCPVCLKLRQPYESATHVHNGYSSYTYAHGVRYHCSHEVDEIMQAQQARNIGESFRLMKKDKRRQAIIDACRPEPKFIAIKMAEIKNAPFSKCTCGYEEPIACPCGYGFIHDSNDYGRPTRFCDACGSQPTGHGLHLYHTGELKGLEGEAIRALMKQLKKEVK